MIAGGSCENLTAIAKWIPFCAGIVVMALLLLPGGMRRLVGFSEVQYVT